MKGIKFAFILNVVLVLLIIPFISATDSCLSQLFSNEVMQLNATVNSTASTVNFYFNPAGKSCDELDIINLIDEFGLDLDLEKTSIKMNISDFLEDINFKAIYREDVDYIEFIDIDINNESEIMVTYNDKTHATLFTTELFNLMFEFLQDEGYLDEPYNIHSIISTPSILTDLVKEYTKGMPEMYGNAELSKSGNYYSLSYDQGFYDLKEEHNDWFNTTIEAIEHNESWSLNVNDYLLDIFSWADSIPYLEEGGNLSIKVMPGELSIIDGKIKTGTYQVPVELSFGDETTIQWTNLKVTEDLEVYSNATEDLEEGEQIADEQNVTIEANTTTIVFNNASIVVENIIIPPTIEANKTISLDMSSLLALAGGVTVPNEIVLERDTSNIDYKVTIPANTAITGTGWDGILDLPTVTTLTTSLGEVNTIVEMGDTNVRLNFDKAVKVVLAGMTGKKALWSDSTGTYAISLCDSSANSTSAGTLTSGECYFDDGSDLVIWTYHFTKFGAYTPTSDEEEEEDEDGNGYSTKNLGGDLTPNSNIKPSLNPLTNINLGNSNDKKGLGITGAVVGALTNPLFWLFINVTVILGIILIFLSRKRKRDMEKLKEKIKQELDKKEQETEQEDVLDIFKEEVGENEKEQEKKPAKKKKKKTSSKKKNKK